MVAATSPIQITSIAQYNQVHQLALANTVLNPDLQNVADIINDKSGKYSDSDKLKAYLQEYTGYAAIQAKASSTQIQQEQAFRYNIQGSSIALAIADAEHKVFQWQRVSVWSDETARSQLWASLSDVQKQLPQIQNWKPAEASSGAASSLPIQDPVTISATAQSLFRGEGSTIRIQQLSGAQWDALAEQDVHNTTLAPGLQGLADIINDRSGKYSDADKVGAYTRAYNALTSLLTTQESGITHEQGMQYDRFREVIASSAIGEAANGGALKLSAFESAHGGIEGSNRGTFYAGLSDLEKQLPEFKNLGRSLGDLIKENAVGDPKAYLQRGDRALSEAQLLFGTDPTTAEGKASGSVSTSSATSRSRFVVNA
jgi:hypothetical protein